MLDRTRSPTSGWTRARARAGRTPRPVHGRHGARDRRADRGGDRAGRRVHRVHRRGQHEPRHRPDRPEAVQRREGDRAGDGPGARGLVRRAGAAHDLPDQARDRDVRTRASRQSWRSACTRSSPAPARSGGTSRGADRQGPRGHPDRVLARRATWPSRRSSSTRVQYGDATELWVLERAGIQRADLVIAVTGDDEDNMLVCQVAKEKYLCDRIIARVNNPRNHDHFRLLGIQPAVSATDLILRLIEHEVPRYGLVHLLALEEERLEIIELEVSDDAAAVGQKVVDISLPEGSLIISVLRGGAGFVPKADTMIEVRRRGPAGAGPGPGGGRHRLLRRPKASPRAMLRAARARSQDSQAPEAGSARIGYSWPRIAVRDSPIGSDARFWSGRLGFESLSRSTRAPRRSGAFVRFTGLDGSVDGNSGERVADARSPFAGSVRDRRRRPRSRSGILSGRCPTSPRPPTWSRGRAPFSRRWTATGKAHGEIRRITGYPNGEEVRAAAERLAQERG